MTSTPTPTLAQGAAPGNPDAVGAADAQPAGAESASKARVLFVDDEPNVLSAMRRSLRNDFQVVTADSGREALRLIGEGPPFAVVVCDCRMPEMDGIEALKRIGVASPMTVRVMLTGNIDQETAVRAVNLGEVFRYLTKPCEVELLRKTVGSAVRQHELLAAEKELLERTLHGAIGVLADLLGIAKPEAFGRTARVRRKAMQIAARLDGISAWELDAAALLSQIGCVNLDQALLDKVRDGAVLSEAENAAFAAHAVLGADLIARIPRLERVATIVRYQNKAYGGGGYPADEVKGAKLPIEARVLHAALTHDALSARGWSDAAIVDSLAKTPGSVDPAVLAALKDCSERAGDGATQTVLADELMLGMVLQQDVKTDNGVMLLCRGQEVTRAVKEHLLRFHALGLLSGRLQVTMQAATARQP